MTLVWFAGLFAWFWWQYKYLGDDWVFCPWWGAPMLISVSMVFTASLLISIIFDINMIGRFIERD